MPHGLISHRITACCSLATRGCTQILSVLALLAAFVSVAPVAEAQDYTYPANSGVINVKAAPYNAVGDGVTDDTAAIQQAINAGLDRNKVVYLPNGTYLVSNTLQWNNGDWHCFLSMQGENTARTIIKLKNRCSGFTSASSPKAVILTASQSAQDPFGGGNQAFGNNIRNLTVNTGAGNAGAIGIDYQVSNTGALRDTVIKTSDPGKVGVCGLSMTRSNNGPGLVKNVTITGFTTGVNLNQEIATFTFENLTLNNQISEGIHCGSAVLAVRKLTSNNTAPAVRVYGDGILTLLTANLKGGAVGSAGVELVDPSSRAYIRNEATTGYGALVNNRGTLITGTSLREWTSDAALSLFSGPQKSLNLKVEETPTFYDGNLADWADVGPAAGGDDLNNYSTDDSPAIQAAMNSGKPVVYFHANTDYRLGATITVPPTVKLVLGCGTDIRQSVFKFPGGAPFFKFVGGLPTDTTVFDRFTMSPDYAVIFEDASPRTVAITDILTFTNADVYTNDPGAGKLFIEDISGAPWRFSAPQEAWGRQWDTEGPGGSKIFNNGGTIWALGTKSEDDTVPMAETRNGGKTEILSGLAYGFGTNGAPAYLSDESSISVVGWGSTSYVNGPYTNIVRETRSGVTSELGLGSLYGGRAGGMLPLYAGFSAAPAPVAYRINAGGFVASPYNVDDGRYVTGNIGTYFTSAPIDVSRVSSPAPQPVYQSETDDLGGGFTYTLPRLVPNKSYLLRLHFVERYFTTAGNRIFNVSANGQQLLSNFDIVAATGAENVAVIKEFPVTADVSGNVTLTFTSVKDRALVNGIELF